MPSPNKYSNKRIKYVDKSITELSQEAQKLQRSFWDSFIDQVMLSLSAVGKIIQDTDGNREIINSLGPLIDKDIRPGDGRRFLEWYVDRMNGLGELNEKYFQGVVSNKSQVVSEIAGSNKSKLLEMLGVVNQKIKKGSFLYNLLDFGPVYNKLQKGLITTIFTGQAYDLKGAKEFIIGSRNESNKSKIKNGQAAVATNRSGGAIEGAINGKTFDTFQGYDRNIQKGMATDLNLKYAIYQGGLIHTSREFCIERNDRVFSTEEIEKFGTPEDAYGGYTVKAAGEFDGKKEPYNPFTDLGGWNCRHHLDWISDELAAELLKDQKPVSEQKPEPPKPQPIKDPQFTPKNLNDYEKAVGTKIDKSIFNLLDRDIKLRSDLRSAFFMPGQDYINIEHSERFKRSKWMGEAVVYHEFGHAIDYKRKYRESNEIKAMMQKHRGNKKLTEIYNRLGKIHDRFKSRKSYENTEQILSVMDSIESLRRTLQGGTHRKAYWKLPLSEEKEFVAHLFENKFIGNKWFKKYLPDLYQDMLDFKLE